MTALEDTVVLEASTTELDDVVRLEDPYHRCEEVRGSDVRVSRKSACLAVFSTLGQVEARNELLRRDRAERLFTQSLNFIPIDPAVETDAAASSAAYGAEIGSGSVVTSSLWAPGAAAHHR